MSNLPRVGDYAKSKSSAVESFLIQLKKAKEYSEVWKIVKDTVEYALDKRRRKMILFLDDLPLRLGAYHPLGTNNIVLNRSLVECVEEHLKSQEVLNALVYNLLLHEYLHALGDVSEIAVRRLVYQVCQKCFGEQYIATYIAKKGPWSLLTSVSSASLDAPKRGMKVVTDFEEPNGYII